MLGQDGIYAKLNSVRSAGRRKMPIQIDSRVKKHYTRFEQIFVQTKGTMCITCQSFLFRRACWKEFLISARRTLR